MEALLLSRESATGKASDYFVSIIDLLDVATKKGSCVNILPPPLSSQDVVLGLGT